MKIHVKLTRTIFTLFSPMLHFCTPLKMSKNKGFLKFSGNKEMEHWTEMGYAFSTKPPKWSNTLKQFVDKLPTNCLSVFDYFERLALKGLKE